MQAKMQVPIVCKVLKPFITYELCECFAGRAMKVWLLREGQEPRVLVDVDDYDYNDPKPKRLVHVSHDSIVVHRRAFLNGTHDE